MSHNVVPFRSAGRGAPTATAKPADTLSQGLEAVEEFAELSRLYGLLADAAPAPRVLTEPEIAILLGR